MTQKERMQTGLPYKAWLDGLEQERLVAKKMVYSFNTYKPYLYAKRCKLLKKLFGKTGKSLHIESPFHCDYGYNIEVGENFFANYNLVILDVAKVLIGNNVQCGPNVSITTAGHPIHYQSRNSGYEYGFPIEIGNNVWIGSNVVINPGIKIGNNTVIGSGSVVTKDIPDNVIAVGIPCKVLRVITDADRNYYYKDRLFDVSDY